MIYKQTGTILIIFIITMVVLGTVNHSEQVIPNRNFESFPMTIGQWKGQPSRFDAKVYDILGVDDSILANYINPSGDRVELYVGFYQSQKQGDLIHSPKNCMPGAGWVVTRTSIETVETMENKTAKPMEVIKLILDKGDSRLIVLYWFQSRGRIIASEYMQKIWLVIDSMTKQRTDGSFVRLIAPVTSDETRTLETLKSFARDVFPHLKAYIPS
ncbi:MAG: exosortase C-terminal domain/associated protein EpsI [Pseudomonadota bacterium]